MPLVACDGHACPHVSDSVVPSPSVQRVARRLCGRHAWYRVNRGMRGWPVLALALAVLLGPTSAAHATSGFADDTTTAVVDGQATATPLGVAPAYVPASRTRVDVTRAIRATRSRVPTRIPLMGRISAGFGSRGRLWSRRHTGVDISARYGTAVAAVTSGRVIKIAYDREYGRTIVVRNRTVDVWYAHLAAATVRVGRQVRAGQRIGRVGSSGHVTGPHLHLEVRHHDLPTDPAAFLWGRRRGIPGSIPTWARTGVTPLAKL